MRFNFKNSQFELFPGTHGDNDPHANKPRLLFSKFSLSADTIVLLIIFVIMGIILSFSVGVEKGKRLAAVTSTQPSASDMAKPTAGAAKAFSRSEEIKPTETPQQVEKPVAPKAGPREKRVVYTIQVASFKTEEYANKEVTKLRDLQNKGLDIFVMPKGNYQIVCVGKFSKKAEAVRYSTELKEHYHDCLVRSM